MPEPETLELEQLDLSEPQEDSLLLEADETLAEEQEDADPIAALDEAALLANPRIAAIIEAREAEKEKVTEYRTRQALQDAARAQAEREAWQRTETMESQEVTRATRDEIRKRTDDIVNRKVDGEDVSIDDEFIDDLASIAMQKGQVRQARLAFNALDQYQAQRNVDVFASAPPNLRQAYQMARSKGDWANAVLYTLDAVASASARAADARARAELGQKAAETQAGDQRAESERQKRQNALATPAPTRPVGDTPPNRTAAAQRILDSTTAPRTEKRKAYEVLYGIPAPF